MPKDNKINISTKIMSEIKKGHIQIKPRWYFWVGSLFMIVGLVGLFIVIVFLISLIVFSARTHGQMGAWRFNQFITHFPVWAIFVALGGIWLGIVNLKKYDFSYKTNFKLISILLILVILFSGWLINYLQIDNLWIKRGPAQQIYRKYNGGKQLRQPHWRFFQKNHQINKNKHNRNNIVEKNY